MGRFAFARRRALQTIPLLFGITLLVFLLLKVTPGDPARLMLGARASERQVEELRHRLGLNDPFLVQYVRYVGRVATGDLGTSIRMEEPVTSVIAQRIPVTIWLIGFGSLFSLLISIPLGVIASRRPDGVLDHMIRGFSLLGLTLPPFWLGIVLIVFIALPTGWFPVSGYGVTLGQHVRAMVLPGLTLGIALAPILVRSLRSALIAIRESDFINMAKSVGVRPWALVWKHELPNAVLPLITLLAVSIGYELFGAVVIENTFGLPGLGQAMLQAVSERDYPVVQGITLVFAVMVVLVHLVADLLYTLIDPRVEIR